MKQKQSHSILSKPGRNKISDHTKAAILSLYEDDEFTSLMLGIKDCVSVSQNVHQQKTANSVQFKGTVCYIS